MSSTGSSRGNPAMGDIARSMVVIAVIILAVFGFGRLFSSTPDRPTTPVDYVSVVAQARPAADFDVLAPARLPEGWIANSARFTPTSWHLGVLTAGDDYIGLEESRTSVARMVDRFAEGSSGAGTAQVGGVEWSVRKGPGDRLTYVRRDGTLTILVNSTASRSVTEAYVTSLSAS